MSRPSPLRAKGFKSGMSSAAAVAAVPSLVRGTVSEVTAASRREALHEFHRFEMIVDADKRLESDAGLVFSDDDDCLALNPDTDEECDVTPDSDFQGHREGPLHDAREELKGKTIHTDKYRLDDIWREVAREAKLRGDGEVGLTENKGLTSFDPLIPPSLSEALDCDSPEAIIDDLGRLKLRMEKMKARHDRRSRKSRSTLGVRCLGSVAGESGSSAEESDFDPDRYVAPILATSEGVKGADVQLLQEQEAPSRKNLHDIFPDSASVREALQLLDYSVQSGRPDIVACINLCKQAQQTHCPTNKIATSTEKTDCVIKEKAAPRVATSSPPISKQQPPSLEEFAKLVAGALPVVPKELAEELQEQRRLLERLSAAQEESIRRHSQDQQEAARRRLMAPRPDPLFDLYQLRVPRVQAPCGAIETIQQTSHQTTQQQQFRQRVVPPVVHISSGLQGTPISLSPPVPPPHVIKEELQRVHQQYERILRDERRAWAELIQNQKDAFEKEKKATAEAMRSFALNQERASAEEAKRVIAAQEVRQQRMQHASQVQQQRSMQQILSQMLRESSKLASVSGCSPSEVRKQMLKSQYGAVSLRKARKQPPTNRANGKKKGRLTGPLNHAKDGGEPPQSATKGPYKVASPLVGNDVASATAAGDLSTHTGCKSQVEEVVVLSDGEGAEAEQDARDPGIGGRNRISGSRKLSELSRTSTKTSCASGKRRKTAPTAGVMKGCTTPAPQSTGNSAVSLRGEDLQPPLSHRERSAGGAPPSSHAFDVRRAQTDAVREFENAEESVLGSSSHTLHCDWAGGGAFGGGLVRTFEDNLAAAAVGDSCGCGRREAEAMFMRSIVLLGDNLTPGEVAQKCTVDKAFDVRLYVPSPADLNGEGLQRPCDAYFYGFEREELTPRRRAELRAVEAQTLLEARRRLERIKALSVDSRKQTFGGPSLSFGIGEGGKPTQRLCDLISNDVVRCLIEEESEGDMFAELMRALEGELVRAELHRIIAGNRAGEEDVPSGKTEQQALESVRGLRGSSGSFGVPVFECMSREEMLLRQIEEELVRLVTEATTKAEKPQESGDDISEKGVEERSVGAGCEMGSRPLHSTPVLPEDASKGDDPVWIHEVVRAGDDPLRSPSVESRVASDHVQQQSIQQREHSEEVGSGASLVPSVAAPPIVAVEVEGSMVEAATTSYGTSGDNTIKIVLDVAPVAQLLSAACSLPYMALQAREGAQQHHRVAEPMGLMVEDPRLPCAAEEALPFVEFRHSQCGGFRVAAELIADVPPVRQEMLVPSDPVDDMPLPPPPPATPSITTSFPASKAPRPAEMMVHHEQLVASLCLCEENESHRRQMLHEHEEMLRHSFVMMWDWEYGHMVRVERENRQQRHVLENIVDARLAAHPTPVSAEAAPHLFVEPVRSPMLVPAASSPVSIRDETPAAAVTAGIRDPITRFIFQWMHEFDGRRREKTFGEKLREASVTAEGGRLPCVEHPIGMEVTDGGATTAAEDDRDAEPQFEDVRRRLLMEIDAADSSPWLSSDHTSSLTEGGTPQFAPRRGSTSGANILAAAHRVVPAYGNAYREVFRACRGGETSSSKTTETTRYSSSLSPSIHHQDKRVHAEFRAGASQPSPCERASAAKTSSTTTTSRATTLVSSGSGSVRSGDVSVATNLLETLQRHLNYE